MPMWSAAAFAVLLASSQQGAAALKVEAAAAQEQHAAMVATLEAALTAVAGSGLGRAELLANLVRSASSTVAAAGVGAGDGLDFQKELEAIKVMALGAPDCTKYPRLCEAPFNCGTFTAEERGRESQAWFAQGWGRANNYHGNPHTWCFPIDGAYESYLAQCLIDKDLVKAAHTQHAYTKSGAFGANAFEADGSYCFLEGHCSNEKVTNQTTSDEADRLCDERFGRERWASFGSMSGSGAAGLNDFMGLPQAVMSNAAVGHFTNPTQTAPFVLAACAMGNYHCDVMYCKETYCKDPHFIEKYADFAKLFTPTGRW